MADLKKLRDATKKAQPEAEIGVLGLIGSTLADLEKQFSGDDSPTYRWTKEISQAKEELSALMLPANEWLPIIFGFALVIMIVLVQLVQALAHALAKRILKRQR